MKNMRSIGRATLKCNCCGVYKYNAPCYKWYSVFDDRYLGTICQKCAIREMFGSNYRNNARYKKWIKENK